MAKWPPPLEELESHDDDENDAISRLVSNLRLRHICAALEGMVVDDEAERSAFTGSRLAGTFFASDLGRNRLGVAWGEPGLVALLYRTEHDPRDALWRGVKEWDRNPSHHWKNAPPRLHYLAERVSSHLSMQRLVSAAFWLTSEEPDRLEPLADEKLKSLRGWFTDTEAALSSWEHGIPELAPAAIQIERASRRRGRLYEISEEQGEALLPRHWFREPGGPKTSRMRGDRMTLDYVRVALWRLSQLGIFWPSALELARARGVGEDAKDEEDEEDG
jgi:hypothetical protein